MNRLSRILFIYPGWTTFVSADHEILSRNNLVESHEYKQSKNLFGHLFQQMKLGLWLLKYIFRFKSVYIWFADYHSFLPVLFARLTARKAYLVLGGYDVIHIPELDYGSLKNPLRSFCTRYSIKNATFNLPVADNLEAEARLIAPKANIRTLYTGFDHNTFKPRDTIQRERMAITVCSGSTWQRMRIKGIDKFIEVARILSDVKFVVIGTGDNVAEYFKELPQNVSFVNELDFQDLLEHYQRASVYCQFSIREGLPSAVCEAMLCGCIAVGFNNGGISIAIGDAGYVINNDDINKAAEFINAALVPNNAFARKGRERIMEHFSTEKRIANLESIF